MHTVHLFNRAVPTCISLGMKTHYGSSGAVRICRGVNTRFARPSYNIYSLSSKFELLSDLPFGTSLTDLLVVNGPLVVSTPTSIGGYRTLRGSCLSPVGTRV